MNGELWTPGKPSFTEPYCGKGGSAATDPIIPSYSWDSDKETEQSPKPKNTNEKQLFLKTRNGNTRSTGQQCTAKVEESYGNEATQKADHSLTVKVTKPKIRRNVQR